MPLADKIMELRKKQGWSQIDLADRLDVSRQSVSKWEMAQAVPELDKIIKMSELFAVTTDYLLKDEVPGPESADAPPPPPPEEPPQPQAEPGPGPEAPPAAQKPRRRVWPWVLAACLVAFVVIPVVASVLLYIVEPYSGSVPVSRIGDTPVEQTTVSGSNAVEDGMTEYVYEGESVTSGGFDEATRAAMAAEYAPYGLTCDEDHHWYLDGQRIRVFTDVLTSNGESLTSGDFHGTLRTFSGEGFIDVRTVRDYEHCDEHGSGTLLYLESCDIRLDGEHWVAHHAQEHDEDHHSEGRD